MTSMEQGERALRAAEQIATHLDRLPVDWDWCRGDQMEAIADRLDALWGDLARLMPEPRVMRHGMLMPRVYADAIDSHERRVDGGQGEAARQQALMRVGGG